MEEIQKNQSKISSPLATLQAYEGYYKSPEDKNGVPLGPLVAYAGEYIDPDGNTKNHVGLEYFNFARLESYPEPRKYFAALIAEKIKLSGIKFDAVLGAPMGGIMLATEISSYMGCRAIFGEKKVLEVGDPKLGKKEKSEQVVKRHDIFPGDKIILVEDVCNNFSTTAKTEAIISKKGGQLVAIVCAFNRSGSESWHGIPVLSAAFLPTEQYKQEDELVKALVDNGNIEWDPKGNWDKLLKK